ncbi:type I phosphomannose isomerase catalytic subunit [Alicyclobacillus dauci]|uniref:Mannose-6-phosphate isomerase n=1 Tax=Alicyclobacillus dauci TaxID=1475485 RepID=A0ABY6Z6Q8_9BACL|nr:type I phosphomannose isomerase catalytic subunit [Alicyclobacillus dauci]WAH38368.1 class I mannose-6-phosphate isomerase [Alicyclobacillus dauci]
MLPVKFRPVPMERIWGGHKLKSTFGVTHEAPIGEYWVVSGHPNGMSVVCEGPLEGKTLNELTAAYPEAYLGTSHQSRFPLLIKFLEAEADLSVQIHPDDDYAQQYEGDFGKTEAWYILDAIEGGKVNYGHTFASREEYEKAVQNGAVKDYLRYRDIQKGDLVFVPARTLHALLAGTIVLEIQQTSDVTYRVYDWDRTDANGKPRQLHVDKAAQVLQYGAEDPVVSPVQLQEDEHVQHSRLVECQYFTIESLRARKAVSLSMGREGNPDVVIVAEGQGTLRAKVDGDNVTMSLRPGDAVLIPADVAAYQIDPNGDMTLVRTFY